MKKNWVKPQAIEVCVNMTMTAAAPPPPPGNKEYGGSDGATWYEQAVKWES